MMENTKGNASQTSRKPGGKKWIAYIIFVVVFCLCLVFANDILLAFSPNDKARKVDIDLASLRQDPLTFGIGAAGPMDNMLEEYFLKGWAFAESNFENPHKAITLYFKSIQTGDIYEVPTGPKEDNLLGYQGRYRVHGQYNGYYTVFSTLPIPQGMYRLYAYCYENETNHGLFLSEQVFRKTENGFETCDFVSEEAKTRNLGTSLGSYSDMGIDLVSQEKEMLTVYGFAFTKEYGAAKNKYLQVSDNAGNSRIYTAAELERLDLRDANGLDDYTSGFVARFPFGDFEGPYLDIRVLLETAEGVLLPQTACRYYFDGREQAFFENLKPAAQVAGLDIDHLLGQEAHSVADVIERAGGGVFSRIDAFYPENSDGIEKTLQMTDKAGNSRTYKMAVI